MPGSGEVYPLATKGADAKLPDGGIIDTGVDIITKDSVEKFEKELAAMKSG